MTNNTYTLTPAQIERLARSMRTANFDPSKGKARRTTHTRKNIR
jgi:hypothetical protein